MKNKKYFFLAITASLLFVGCKCEKYYSMTNSKIIETKFFDMQCRLVESPIKGDNDNLEITINYKNDASVKVNRNSMLVVPMNSNERDSLSPVSNYASVYSFNLTNIPEQLDVFVSFNVDSLGVVENRKMSFKGMSKINKCRTRLALH